MTEVVGLQSLKGGKANYYLPQGRKLALETVCVIETEHGLNLARVVKINRNIGDDRAGGNLRKVLRVASVRDRELYDQNQAREQEAFRIAQRKIQERKLPMKLVDVTYTLDSRKAVFFFTAENRVDFRELVKDLAQVLKIKIEMRQIGVRDEARRLGGVGSCGRSLCCCVFLKDFISVSIRMAKDQNLSLNPTKVSGLCGRLMCCLSYEYADNKGKRAKAEKEACAAGGGECACGQVCAAPGAEGAKPESSRPERRFPRPESRGGRPPFGRKGRAA